MRWLHTVEFIYPLSESCAVSVTPLEWSLPLALAYHTIGRIYDVAVLCFHFKVRR